MYQETRPQANSSVHKIWDRLTACEVLHWIAFRELKTWEQLAQDDYLLMEEWGFGFGDEYLAALAARVNPEPYCPVREDFVDQNYDGDFYPYPVYSPQGPRILRHMRATARRRRGGLISYQDLFVEQREELARSEARSNALTAAGTELIKIWRTKGIYAVGQRHINGNEPPGGAAHKKIPTITLEHPAIRITVYNTLTLDINRPHEDWRGALLPFFSNVRFSTAEVLEFWPHEGGEGFVGGKKEADERAPLKGKKLERALENWARNSWPDLYKLPGRDELLRLARNHFPTSKITFLDARGLRSTLAPDKIKKGGSPLHRA